MEPDSFSTTPPITTKEGGTDTLVEVHHHKKNIYPYFRHTILVLFVLVLVCVVLFLTLQNGKSIYDNGL